MLAGLCAVLLLICGLTGCHVSESPAADSSVLTESADSETPSESDAPGSTTGTGSTASTTSPDSQSTPPYTSPSVTQPPSEPGNTEDIENNLLYQSSLQGKSGKADVTVTIDRSSTDFVSQLQLGITHTHYKWEEGTNIASIKSANALLSDVPLFANQHIMGWGALNPWPEKNGPKNYDSLDKRIALFEKLGQEPVITFCQAPGWMKGVGDWEMEKKVLDPYIPDFAALCADIAARYPHVQYFQVWNEFKGYYSGGGWDYVSYTKLYNAVYDAVKAVRPDAKIGGFYMVLEGDGASDILGLRGTHSDMPLQAAAKTALRYWLENKHGADFLCVDRGLKDYHNTAADKLTQEQVMKLVPVYKKVTEELVSMTDLPIFYSEYYGYYDLNKTAKMQEDFVSAQYASIYYNMVMGARERGVTALHWMEVNKPYEVFTSTQQAGGGEALKLYWVMKVLSEAFAPGTAIVKSTVSSSEVEVLASKDYTLLINVTNQSKTVQVNDKSITLKGFETAFFRTP